MNNTPAPPRTRFMRPFTTHVLNPFTRRFAHWLPGFALIGHRGRKSGKHYWTPMNVFRHADTYVFALTYGSDVHWVKNVLATGEAELRIGISTIKLTQPELFVDPGRSYMPWLVRRMLGVMRVTDFFRMRVAGEEGFEPSIP